MTEFAGIILAGGKGVRLGAGANKALIKFGGKPLIQWVTDALQGLCDEIIVSVAEREDFPPLPAVKFVYDAIPNGGALAGLYSSLSAMNADRAIVVAADMPFLSRELIRYMKNNSGVCDALIPRIGDNIEPLHAVYSKRCLDAIKRKIDAGRKQIRSFYEDIEIEYLMENVVSQFDPSGMAFFNINTAADLRKAESVISSRMAAHQ